MRGIAILEMISNEAYGAINGAFVTPMTVSRALPPFAAAALWSATGSYATEKPFGPANTHLSNGSNKWLPFPLQVFDQNNNRRKHFQS